MSECSGPSISNSPGASLQNAWGNNNTQIENRNTSSDTAPMTKEEAIETLAQVEKIIISANALEKDDQESVLQSLGMAKSELTTKEPSKGIVLATLEKADNLLKRLSNISNSAANLCEKVLPHLSKVVLFVSEVMGNIIK